MAFISVRRPASACGNGVLRSMFTASGKQSTVAQAFICCTSWKMNSTNRPPKSSVIGSNVKEPIRSADCKLRIIAAKAGYPFGPLVGQLSGIQSSRLKVILKWASKAPHLSQSRSHALRVTGFLVWHLQRQDFACHSINARLSSSNARPAAFSNGAKSSTRAPAPSGCIFATGVGTLTTGAPPRSASGSPPAP